MLYGRNFILIEEKYVKIHDEPDECKRVTLGWQWQTTEGINAR